MIKLEHAIKEYGHFKLDCSMEIKRGRITGLVGKNASGKTTTFKAIIGLIRLDSGNVRVFGENPRNMDPRIKEKIGVVWADAGFSLQFNIKRLSSVLDEMYPAFSKEVFLDLCKQYELPYELQLKKFSTGMKAKLKVLIAISHKAELLILDEPTLGLDVEAREVILNLLREYMEEDENRTILISSHISSDLERLCDDVYFIADGKIILHEETDCLLSEYGILKVTKNQFEDLDKQYLLDVKEESFGYSCLTDQRRFYQENHPGLIIEQGSIDDLILRR